MKIRVFLAVLLLTMVIIYFIFFAKSGEKSGIRTNIDHFSKSRIELTKVNMASLERIIVAFLGSQGRLPSDSDELRKFQAGGGFQDAWGREIRYETLTDSSFRLTSGGPDGEFGTSDDLIREY